MRLPAMIEISKEFLELQRELASTINSSGNIIGRFWEPDGWHRITVFRYSIKIKESLWCLREFNSQFGTGWNLYKPDDVLLVRSDEMCEELSISIQAKLEEFKTVSKSKEDKEKVDKLRKAMLE